MFSCKHRPAHTLAPSPLMFSYKHRPAHACAVPTHAFIRRREAFVVQMAEGRMTAQEMVLARAEQLHTAAQTLRQHALYGLTDPAGREAIRFSLALPLPLLLAVCGARVRT